MSTNSNGSRKTSVYSPVILNSKAKEVISNVFRDIKSHAELAKVKISFLKMSVVMDEKNDISYVLSFYHGSVHKKLECLAIEDFNMKFIEYLFENK